MDGSRKLTLALGAVVLVSTVTAVTLAVRPTAQVPGLPVETIGRPSDPGGPVPTEPRPPGGVNAIAARAIADGGPRTPTVPPSAGAPRRSVTRFRVAFDAGAGAPAWGCVAAAGAHATGHLDTGGTLDGLADPAVAAACGGTGPDTLEGFVRVATVPVRSADGGSQACEATVSYTLTRAGRPAAPRELRGERVQAEVPSGCATSLDALEGTLTAQLTAG